MTKNLDPKNQGMRLSRRTLIGGAAGAAGVAAFSATPFDSVLAEVEELKSQGWEAHPCACNVCGGYCGLLAMHKKGTAVSQETVRIMPNPTHPQRGYCARGASAMYVWNHPLRLKKPMKRVGERGEGKFQEISWDEALTGIANKMKEIVETYGEKSIAMTSHNFSAFQQWLGGALGTPNVISHSSTCNSASVVGRRMVFGKAFDGAGKVEPDYANCRYLLLIGRTLNCAMGVNSVVQRARHDGITKAVFVDPRMPEGAFGGDDWIPIVPGTDAAFILALMNVGYTEGLIDIEFLRKYTNAPYLVTLDGKPILAKDTEKFEGKEGWLVMDRANSKLALMSVKKNEKDEVTAIVDPEGVDPDLGFKGEIELASGVKVEATTVYNVFTDMMSKYTPKVASLITKIPEEKIVKVARDFFTLGGVADDGWYSSRNGNDAEIYALICLLNVLTGRIDTKGGFVVTAGGGFKAPGAGQGKGPNGQKWKVEGKSLDKTFYPEGSGTFSAIFDAITKGEPYPIKGVFVTGSTMFHREANSDRMAKAFKALDLLVVQDIFPHEVIDYADYVLPCTFFLEWHEYAGVKWALNGNVQKNDAHINPPEGVDAREEVWQFCEILRRAYPDRAAQRLGYDHEMKTREEFKKWYDGMMDEAWAKFIAKKNEECPGEGDRIQAAIDKDGWAQVKAKKYNEVPYKKPFATPTGKCEFISFAYAAKGYDEKGFKSLPTYNKVEAYTAPKPLSNEFYLVSGKDSASSSGVALFTWPQKFLGDRTLWINPVDASRLDLKTGDMVEVESIDTGVKGQTKVKVTNRVMPGSLFSVSFNGAVRTKTLNPQYEYLREGINSHWFCTGYRQNVVGALANNSSVRIRKL